MSGDEQLPPLGPLAKEQTGAAELPSSPTNESFHTAVGFPSSSSDAGSDNDLRTHTLLPQDDEMPRKPRSKHGADTPSSAPGSSKRATQEAASSSMPPPANPSWTPSLDQDIKCVWGLNVIVFPVPIVLDRPELNIQTESVIRQNEFERVSSPPPPFWTQLTPTSAASTLPPPPTPQSPAGSG